MNDSTWTATLQQAAAAAWERALTHVPSIVGAALLLVLGWLVAKLLRTLTVRSVTRASALLGDRRIDGEIRAAGVDRFVPAAAGTLVFWLVFVLFVAATAEILGLAVISTGFGRLAEYLPSILGAALVLVVGVVAGNLVRTMATRTAARAGLAYGGILGQALRWAILLVAAVVALDQIGIDSQLLITATTVLIASMVGGVALAFALGSRGTVADVLAMHYVVQVYRPGQRIRIDDLEGEIAEFKKTGVLIDTPAGRVLVPAHEFREKRSTLVAEGRP